MSTIHALLQAAPGDAVVCVQAWIRTSRFSKRVTFLHLTDGSSDTTLQVVVRPAVSPALRARLTTGASVRITGTLVESPGPEQPSELLTTAEQVTVIGDCAPEDYPIQKKHASAGFYRGLPHLRPRVATYQRIFRLRSLLSLEIHRFLSEQGFLWVHTPLLTASDCEGAGEMFQVSAPGRPGFFDRPAHLTVSGQLEAEALACALGRVYTFGPAFRAEDSHTARHAAEFWMLEPEVAFADLDAVIDLAERTLRHLAGVAEDAGLGAGVDASAPFARITHAEAVRLLAQSGRSFDVPVAPDMTLKSEHERCLCEEVFGGPLFVTHYPRAQKPFYMRVAPGGETVECFDLLVPGVGELIGGSAREERLDVLEEQLARHGIDPTEYAWYLDLRRFGSVPHGGFGMGLERAVMWLGGVDNIRDTLPFPRTAGRIA